MVQAFINRIDKSDTQTLGIFTAYNKMSKLFELKTLELPYRNNDPNVSCIPSDEYIVRLTKSQKFGVDLYEVLNVQGRSGIRIHKANYFTELLGCIAVGVQFIDLNNDGFLDVTNSKLAQEFMMGLLGKEFRLSIS